MQTLSRLQDSFGCEPWRSVLRRPTATPGLQDHPRSNIALLRSAGSRTAAASLGSLPRGPAGGPAHCIPVNRKSNASNIETSNGQRVSAFSAPPTAEADKLDWVGLIRAVFAYLGILLVVFSLTVLTLGDGLARGGGGEGFPASSRQSESIVRAYSSTQVNEGGTVSYRSSVFIYACEDVDPIGSNPKSGCDPSGRAATPGDSSDTRAPEGDSVTAVAAASTASRGTDTEGLSDAEARAVKWLLIIFFFLGWSVNSIIKFLVADSVETPKVEVHRIQVALHSSVREELQGDLEQLAEEADTSSRVGLHALLQGSLLALFRRSSYFAFGSVYDKKCRTEAESELEFSNIALKEIRRSRNITKRNSGGQTAVQGLKNSKQQHRSAYEAFGKDSLVVVTLLVAARLPGGGGGTAAGFSFGGFSHDVKGALQRLSAVAEKDVLDVEVLWTPEGPGDTLSRLQVYPELRPL